MQRLIRKIFTTFYRVFNYRPSSAPYISGDTFRSIADYVYDPTVTNIKYKLSTLRNHSVIFVKTNELEEFMIYRSHIPKRQFTIICHNSDLEFNSDLYSKVNFLGDTFYSQNCTTKQLNVIPVPIGLENSNYHINGIVSRYKRLEKNEPFLAFIFYSFSVHTNISVRSRSLQYLRNSPVAIGKARMNNSEYLNEMRNYMFCFSPPGNGIDTHRTWEAIAINVIPICFKSALTDYFEEIGLPILVIESLSDLNKYLDQTKLMRLYYDIKAKSTKDPSYFDYWKNEIKVIKKNILWVYSN